MTKFKIATFLKEEWIEQPEYDAATWSHTGNIVKAFEFTQEDQAKISAAKTEEELNKLRVQKHPDYHWQDNREIDKLNQAINQRVQALSGVRETTLIEVARWQRLAKIID